MQECNLFIRHRLYLWNKANNVSSKLMFCKLDRCPRIEQEPLFHQKNIYKRCENCFLTERVFSCFLFSTFLPLVILIQETFCAWRHDKIYELVFNKKHEEEDSQIILWYNRKLRLFFSWSTLPYDKWKTKIAVPNSLVNKIVFDAGGRKMNLLRSVLEKNIHFNPWLDATKFLN